MTAVAGLFKPVNLEAMATSRIINGNSEKNALKANASARSIPSIRRNLRAER